MAATYDATDLQGSELFRARFALGDTDVANALLQDEEIEAQIAMYGYAEGVALCCDGLVTRFAQDPDEASDEGGVKVVWRERIAAWKDLAKRLRAGQVQTEEPVAKGAAMSGVLTAPDMTDYR